MVFETVLSSLLNSVLGDYLENLDASQLNIAILRGHLVLTNLRLKQTALDDIDLPLPLKLKSGLLKKLTLKIPWLNLYTAPVVAEAEGLYVLVVPHIGEKGMKYNAEEEAKDVQRLKLEELKKIEETRKAEQQQVENGKNVAALQEDSFTEKMVTQIVRNLQVFIKGVHIRYEDTFTIGSKPFAVGITLNSLYFQTTTENWKPAMITEKRKFFFKLIDLNCFGFYWNTSPELYCKYENDSQVNDALAKGIATPKFVPENMGFILDPISISIQLQLNPKPETDGTNFTTPKLIATMSINEISLHLGNYQYDSILAYTESLTRLKLNVIYRKFRPDLKEYKRHAKEWWHFAINCILDEIRRRHIVWSWEHIKNHRHRVKKYSKLWIEKLTNKNASKDVLKTIENLEKELDAFNLNIGRQTAELEIKRRGLKHIEEEQGWAGWIAGWWGGGEKGKKQQVNVVKQIEKEWTKEERQKLYAAIDYRENEKVIYPPEFVERRINILLKALSITGYDDRAQGHRNKVLAFKMESVSADIIQQPATHGLFVSAKMPLFSMIGKSGKSNFAPKLEACEFNVDYTLNMEDLKGTIVTVAFNEVTMTLSMSFEQFLSCIGLGKTSSKEESGGIQKAKRMARKHVWDVKKVKDCRFWFLKGCKFFASICKLHVAENELYLVATSHEIMEVKEIKQNVIREELIVALSVVNAMLETVPMPPASPVQWFNLVFGFNATIRNWTKDLAVDGGMSMEIAYFNEKLKVWEPVLEPVEHIDEYKPWEILLSIQSQTYFELTDDESLPPPKMAISIVSTDALQLTLTKTFLEMYRECYKDIFKTPEADLADLSSRYRTMKEAPVTFHNVLPYPVALSGQNIKQIILQGGECISWDFSASSKTAIEVKVLTQLVWSSTIIMEKTQEELTAHTFKAVKPDNSFIEMDLGIRTTSTGRTIHVSLYCPFWILNKTGLPLCYRGRWKFAWCVGCRKDENKSPVTVSPNRASAFAEHAANSTEPLLFTFNGKRFFKKKKACLKVSDSDWSKKFPLDTLGTTGRIICKTRSGYNYEISLTVQLSHSGLTKICTFTPFYLINNICTADIEVRENGSADWLLVPSKKVIPFWPRQYKKNRLMHVRYFGTAEESLPFPFIESFESFVPIQNEYVGIDVCCHVSEHSVLIEIDDYQDGMAPALLINATESFTITYVQDQVKDCKSLEPGTCVMFNWERLTGRRELVWTCGNRKNVKDNLFKDGTGDYSSTDKPERKGYWVSFLDSRQRVLLFTEDLAIAVLAQAYETERIDYQTTLSFGDVGISLVDDQIGKEIAFMSITSSGLVWEYKKKRYYKALAKKESDRMEDAYVRYMTAKLAGERVKSRQTFGRMQVDFELMHQYKPVDRRIRRSFQAGFWLQYKLSVHQQQWHIKVNHLQVDNQLPHCVFPVAFAPVPPPPSVTAESIPKPFAEISYVARKAEHSTVPQVKYFKILVQEMAVRLDNGFTSAYMSYYYGNINEASLYTPELYRKDLELTRHDLNWYASIVSSNEQKIFYDHLHFSPIILHFSFSQGGYAALSATKVTQIPGEFLNLFMKSIGVTLTDVQDVVFKLAYFQRQAIFLNNPQLWAAVTDHYTKQAIKQAYVFILGLDIIGNPFGLVRDMSIGVETFFYEPYQGAIQGPEEFAEGLALGVKSLFGNAVGGAAGAVSLITCTLGKGVAALTLDEEYQKKRQQTLSQKSPLLYENLMQGGKGMLMGFYSGITGVVTKPVEGAREEGAAGFIKGVGKGLVGFVALPIAGIIDFTSTSFDSVKRLTGASTAEVNRIRSPRYIRPDKIVHVFNKMEADGNRMLQTIAKGIYSRTDQFVAFSRLTSDERYYIIVTSKRMIMTERNVMFGNLEIVWAFTWEELSEAPTASDSKLIIKLKSPIRRRFRLSRTPVFGKIVHVPSSEIGQWLADQCQKTFDASHGQD